MLQNLIVPCSCRCRYCLLAWDGKVIGCNYKRSEIYAKAFHDWLSSRHPEISFNFSFGYSMDHPELIQVIDFLNSIGSISGRFLQMNGLTFKNVEEKDALMRDLLRHGVQSVNFTFYGSENYHDQFAGRTGDFQHNLSMADAANQAGLSVSVGVALTAENYMQMDDLYSKLESRGISNVRLFIPHEERRGISLAGSRCSLKEYNRLSGKVRELLNRKVYRTESEWISATDLQPETKRSLLISLTQQNINWFEQIGFEETIKYMEDLDDEYYRNVPEFSVLLKQYGNPFVQELYGKRDLYQHYQKKYLHENSIDIYDVTDERQCGSRRY